MNKLKKLFATPKKAILSAVCAIAILLLLGTGTVYAAGAIAQSSSIGAENAQNFAFADAGIDPICAQLVHTEFDFEMGQFIYDVEFTANGTEYEYWIKASNGTVLKKSVEIVTLDGTNVTATAKITLDQAKEIALSDAGLTASQVTFTEGKLDVEDGISLYDICFYAENTEYEYEILADTGAIYSRSKETYMPEVNVPTAPTQPNEGAAPVDSQSGTTQISLEAAKSKALADAGLAADAVTYTKARLDMDDGVAVYEIDFYTATQKYEYEIHAVTGAVLDRSVETIEVAAPKPQPGDADTQNPNGYIGVEQAKAIAVGKAGLSVSDVTFKKAKLDIDDGVAVYEIEFFYNGMEYECEIHAVSGEILEFDSERDD